MGPQSRCVSRLDSRDDLYKAINKNLGIQKKLNKPGKWVTLKIDEKLQLIPVLGHCRCSVADTKDHWNRKDTWSSKMCHFIKEREVNSVDESLRESRDSPRSRSPSGSPFRWDDGHHQTPIASLVDNQGYRKQIIFCEKVDFRLSGWLRGCNRFRGRYDWRGFGAWRWSVAGRVLLDCLLIVAWAIEEVRLRFQLTVLLKLINIFCGFFSHGWRN